MDGGGDDKAEVRMGEGGSLLTGAGSFPEQGVISALVRHFLCATSWHTEERVRKGRYVT